MTNDKTGGQYNKSARTYWRFWKTLICDIETYSNPCMIEVGKEYKLGVIKM
jgi:hypothetical protein